MKSLTNKFSKKQLIIGSIAIIALVAIISNLVRGDANANLDAVVAEDGAKKVTLIDLNNLDGRSEVVASGMVEAVNEASIVAEGSGVVRSLPVKIGQKVSRGAVLANLSGGDQAASVEQARAAVAIQEAQLNDLLRNAPNSESATSDKILIAEQQEKNIKNAYRTLLNTDLKAYVVDLEYGQDNGVTPVISGVYNSEEEGDYFIETYSSNAPSGISYRLSGMGSGTFDADVNSPQPLGTKGLQIQFPDVGAKELSRQKWVVSVPNTRSASYVSSLNAYEAAKEGKGVALQQNTVSEERIESQRASVRQAQANLQAAQSQLAKTSIRAPFAGTVLSISTHVGEFVSTGQAVLTLVSESNQEIHVYVASENAKNINIGAAAMIDEKVEGVVSSKAPGIDSATGKVEVIVSPNEASELLAIGEFVNVTIATVSEASDKTKLPLKAVRTTVSGSTVFTVNDGILTAVPVETGAMQGNDIEIISGLEGVDSVIANVRGLIIGDEVTI